MAFIFIGKVNVLAPIVSINFLLTYGFIDYSYFSVAMAYSRLPTETQAEALPPGKRLHLQPLLEVRHQNYGSGNRSPATGKGTLLEFTQDMDRIFSLDPDGNLTVERDESGEPGTTQAAGSRSAGKSGTPRNGAKQALLESFSLDKNTNLCRNEEPHRGASEAGDQRADDEMAGPAPLPEVPQMEAPRKQSLGQQGLRAGPQNPNTRCDTL